MDDLACLRAIQQGSEAALRELYERHHRTLFRLAWAVLRDQGSAEEVLQDTFVRVWRDAAKFDPELGHPLAWLVTIARRLAIDHLRRNRARQIFITPGEQNRADFDQNGIRPGPPPAWEVRQALSDIMRPLSPVQRTCLELVYLQGFALSEAASHLGRPVGTVKSDLHRALQRLRDFAAHEHARPS